MKYEVVEPCAWCGEENIMEWNIEQDGYVAYCPHCGKKMMLCDECIHSDDNPNMHCDWREDCDFGTCFRDNRPVILETYGAYNESVDEYDALVFKVPRNWLMKHIKGKYKNIEEFLNNYIWDETEALYDIAVADGVIIKEELI